MLIDQSLRVRDPVQRWNPLAWGPIAGRPAAAQITDLTVFCCPPKPGRLAQDFGAEPEIKRALTVEGERGQVERLHDQGFDVFVRIAMLKVVDLPLGRGQVTGDELARVGVVPSRGHELGKPVGVASSTCSGHLFKDSK